ncbi:hypothetical protein ACIGC1_27965 [Peribacillus butanolivorans]|uniref:hypothetical protein n=1 Tax=Peribacillus butanolivorans TaxID=421767 RepID=UPI0037C5AED9
MNILIRGVDPIFAKELEKKANEISKKIGRDFSRNEYILMLIQNDCELRLTKLKEDKFDQAVDSLSHTLDRQTDKLQEFINSNNRLFHLLASGIDNEDQGEEL